MWVLRKIKDGTTKYLVSEKKSYTVGRKNCDIVFEEDSSVSRKHCTIFIAKQNECPFQVNTLTGVWVVDLQSKYGTFVRNSNEWVKISPNKNCELSHGSIIKFGLMENIWSFEYKPLVVCTSGIQSSQKNKIESILKSVDGEVRNVWCKQCSLVIVNELNLTVKVVLALILGVPIVTPSYIEKVVVSIMNQTPFPKYEDHRPEIKESILDASLVSLDIKNNRKELFKGKTFLIPTQKQFETLNEIITSAGGKAEILSLNGSWLRFAEKNTILIQSPSNDPSVSNSEAKSFKDVAMYLQNKHSRRTIPESEIPQAVAYSSIEKFCNPEISCFSLRKGVQKNQDEGDILVEETPDIFEEKIPDPCFVPNSATINSQFEDIFEPHCSKSVVDGSFMNLPIERKRAHSPIQLDECNKKKARKSGKFAQDINNPVLENSSVKERTPKKTENKTGQKNVNPEKSSYISDYFKKLNKSIENIKKESDNSDFWNYENCTLKRKGSTESSAEGETSRKKGRFLGKNQLSPELEIDTPREVVEVVQSKTSVPAPAVRNFITEEKDFSDYFGKDMVDVQSGISELDNTIFSLTLISPAYLNADGSLIDPPSTPVNVKKFKKQKLESMVAVDLMKGMDDLSDGEWIEPHPREVTVGGGKW